MVDLSWLRTHGKNACTNCVLCLGLHFSYDQQRERTKNKTKRIVKLTRQSLMAELGMTHEDEGCSLAQ